MGYRFRVHVIESFPFVVPPSSPDRPPGASAVAVASKATRRPYVGRGGRPTRCCLRLAKAAHDSGCRVSQCAISERPLRFGARSCIHWKAKLWSQAVGAFGFRPEFGFSWAPAETTAVTRTRKRMCVVRRHGESAAFLAQRRVGAPNPGPALAPGAPAVSSSRRSAIATARAAASAATASTRRYAPAPIFGSWHDGGWPGRTRSAARPSGAARPASASPPADG